MKEATSDQITQLRRHAVNTVTNDIKAHGVRLSWGQVDDLGNEVIDWMRSRLGLKSTTSDHGVTFKPDPSVRSHAKVRPRDTADIRAITSLAEQDTSGEVDDSYARTGDAEDTIRRWRSSARSAGDTDLVETIDRMGISSAARAYEAARRGSSSPSGRRSLSGAAAHPRAHAAMRDDGGVTDAQIRALRQEAASAGDHAQVLLCDLALGDVELDEDTPFKGLRITGFLSPRDKRRIAAMSPDDYREACASAIEAGKG